MCTMSYYMLFLFLIPALHLEPIKHAKDAVTQEVIQKESAFKVLQTKCNVCHAVKKRADIFTYKNMDSLANAINEQVFIKKKMPKGKKIKLTNSEEKKLLLWIAQTKKRHKKKSYF